MHYSRKPLFRLKTNHFTFQIKLLHISYFSFTIAEDGHPVPGVVLLIEGGHSSIRLVHNALDANPQIPVVVIAKSGRAASVLSEAWEHHIKNGYKGYVMFL